MNNITAAALPHKIGMLDSGIGGLSVLNALIPFLPPEVVYIADAAHLPYGQKTADFLIERGIAITRFFESQGITTIFVACHTLSATAVPTLKLLFPHITYVDLLPLTIERAATLTQNNRLGVMATQATITTHIHKKILKELSVTIPTTLIEQPCPDFVPLIERKATPQEYEQAINQYLTPLLIAEVDTIILGCTHYPFIQKLLEEKAPYITFISAANSLPAFEKSSTPSTIHFVTTAPIEYMQNGTETYLTQNHEHTITFESQKI